jgi:hypothetical protein
LPTTLDLMEQADLDKRFTYHAPDAAKIELHNTVRNMAKAAADAFNAVVPEGREKALAITKLEEAMMWGNAGIARHVAAAPEEA